MRKDRLARWLHVIATAMAVLILITALAAHAQKRPQMSERAKNFYNTAKDVQWIDTIGRYSDHASMDALTVKFSLVLIGAPKDLSKLWDKVADELQKPASKRDKNMKALLDKFVKEWETYYRNADNEAFTYGMLGGIAEMASDHYTLKAAGFYDDAKDLRQSISDVRDVFEGCGRSLREGAKLSGGDQRGLCPDRPGNARSRCEGGRD